MGGQRSYAPGYAPQGTEQGLTEEQAKRIKNMRRGDSLSLLSDLKWLRGRRKNLRYQAEQALTALAALDSDIAKAEQKLADLGISDTVINSQQYGGTS